MVLFIVELSVTFSVEKNTTLNTTNLDTLLMNSKIKLSCVVSFCVLSSWAVLCGLVLCHVDWIVHTLAYVPTQVKCPLLISSIFDAMNFQHMLEFHCIKNARN